MALRPTITLMPLPLAPAAILTRFTAALAFLTASLSIIGATVEPAPTPEQFRRFALLHEGNASHGQAIFQDEQRLGCTRCHSVDGTASQAGFDLIVVGVFFV